MIDMRAGWRQPAISILAVNLLGILLSADAAWADDPVRVQTQEIESKPTEISSKRTGAAKAPARKPTRKQPDQSGNFVYGIINQIRVHSEELCARYGSPSDCLEEAEVCLTMRDTDDNQVRLCLNTAPGDSGDNGSMQKSRLRR